MPMSSPGSVQATSLLFRIKVIQSSISWFFAACISLVVCSAWTGWITDLSQIGGPPRVCLTKSGILF